MVPRWLQLTGLTLLLGFAVVPAARADTRWSVSIGVGAPRGGGSTAPYGYDRYRYRDYGYDRYGYRDYGYDRYRYRDDRRWDIRGRWDGYQGRGLKRDRDWREHARDGNRGDWRR